VCVGGWNVAVAARTEDGGVRMIVAPAGVIGAPVAVVVAVVAAVVVVVVVAIIVVAVAGDGATVGILVSVVWAGSDAGVGWLRQPTSQPDVIIRPSNNHATQTTGRIVC